MAQRKVYVYRDNRVRLLKPGVDLQVYLAKYPGAVKIGNPPSQRTMERWMNDCVAKAVDGCRVEPDGHCQHGLPSWLLAQGLI